MLPMKTSPVVREILTNKYLHVPPMKTSPVVREMVISVFEFKNY
jgi:hypothetical protein